MSASSQKTSLLEPMGMEFINTSLNFIKTSNECCSYYGHCRIEVNQCQVFTENGKNIFFIALRQKTTSFDRNLSFSVIFALRRVICTFGARYCFAGDMPAGMRGEYNITETAGFNITFCTSKIYHSAADGISQKTNRFTRVRIHAQVDGKYVLCSPCQKNPAPRGVGFFCLYRTKAGVLQHV